LSVIRNWYSFSPAYKVAKGIEFHTLGLPNFETTGKNDDLLTYMKTLVFWHDLEPH
jgi:hypothetical protein